MKAVASLQIPASRFDDAIREVWMSAAARCKATWEARAVASTSSCTNHFAGEGAALDNIDASSSLTPAPLNLPIVHGKVMLYM
jgi:hypothetical protein